MVIGMLLPSVSASALSSIPFCLCMYFYIYVHICIYVCMYVCLNGNRDAFAKCLGLNSFLDCLLSMYVFIHIYTYMYLCLHVCMCAKHLRVSFQAFARRNNFFRYVHVIFSFANVNIYIHITCYCIFIFKCKY